MTPPQFGLKIEKTLNPKSKMGSTPPNLVRDSRPASLEELIVLRFETTSTCPNLGMTPPQLGSEHAIIPLTKHHSDSFATTITEPLEGVKLDLIQS